MKLLRALITVLVASGGPGAFCQQPGKSPFNHPKTTIEMRECAAFRLKKAEMDLRKTCAALMAKLPDEAHRKLLVASQEAWETFRDTEAGLEGYFYNGGTIEPQIRIDCLTRTTLARVEDLRRLLKEESGH
jgi:uncharacterized protein YecT (DUF1311 family)